MRRRLYFCDQHGLLLPAGHRFPAGKYQMLRELLAADSDYEMVAAPYAAVEDICRIHERSYVEQFLVGTLPPQAIRRIGFPWSEQLVKRTLASVGGTLAAAADALEFGFGANLAGGTHHAFRTHGSGFCVFNDIAVAIAWARGQGDHDCKPPDGDDWGAASQPEAAWIDKRRASQPLMRRFLAGKLARVAVIDCDVHQGDGTAQIFENEDEVFTLSLHGRKNFPFRKQRSKLDLELEDGTEDDEYLLTLERGLRQLFEFGPELVFFQSGVDGLACDTLGRLALTHEGLARRDRLVLESCRGAKIPVVITLGGGYGSPIEETVRAHANTYRLALQVFGRELPCSTGTAIWAESPDGSRG